MVVTGMRSRVDSVAPRHPVQKPMSIPFLPIYFERLRLAAVDRGVRAIRFIFGSSFRPAASQSAGALSGADNTTTATESRRA